MWIEAKARLTIAAGLIFSVGFAGACGASPSGYVDEVAERMPADVVALVAVPHFSVASPWVEALWPEYDLAGNTIGADPDAPAGVALLANGRGVVVLSYGLAEPLDIAGLASSLHTERSGEATLCWKDHTPYVAVVWEERVVVLDGRHAALPAPPVYPRDDSTVFGATVALDQVSTTDLLEMARELAVAGPEASLAGQRAFRLAFERSDGATGTLFLQSAALRRLLLGGEGAPYLTSRELGLAAAVMAESDGLAVGLSLDGDTPEVVAAFGGATAATTLKRLSSESETLLARLPEDAYGGVAVELDPGAAVAGIDRIVRSATGHGLSHLGGPLEAATGIDLERDLLANLTGSAAMVVDAPLSGRTLGITAFAGVSDPDLSARVLWQIVSSLRAAAGGLLRTHTDRVRDIDLHDMRMASGTGVTLAVFDDAIWVATQPGRLAGIIAATDPEGAGPFAACPHDYGIYGFVDGSARDLVAASLGALGIEHAEQAAQPSGGLRRLCWGVATGATSEQPTAVPALGRDENAATSATTGSEGGAATVLRRIGLGPKLGYASPDEMAQDFVSALRNDDWDEIRARFPDDTQLAAWCPTCRTPMVRHLDELRGAFHDCAQRIGGRELAVRSVRGGEDNGRTKRVLRSDIVIARDVDVVLDDGEGRSLEFDNPLIVKGRYYPLELHCWIKKAHTPPPLGGGQ